MQLYKILTTASVMLALAACSCGNKISSTDASSIGQQDDSMNTAAVGAEESSLIQAAGSDRVLFAFDSSALSAEATDTLTKQAEFLKLHPAVAVVIEGHADERGTREYNLGLGERRAAAAKHYLVLKGVAADRIGIVSYGKERPAVDGHNEEAWRENRRAVTVVIAAEGSMNVNNQ